MTHPNANVPDALRSLGLRAAPDALAAFFAHATKSRFSPVQTVEQLVALERKEREVRNLAQRTRLANALVEERCAHQHLACSRPCAPRAHRRKQDTAYLPPDRARGSCMTH